MILSLTLILSRLFVSGLICAAVVSVFVCPATALIIPADNGVTHNNLKSHISRSNLNPPLLTAPLSTETELHTGTNSETETSGNYRKVFSLTGRQSNLFHVSRQNSPGNKPSAAGIVRVQGAHGAGAVRPASSTFTTHFPFGGQSFEEPRINNQSPPREAAGAFYPRFLQFWPRESFQNSYDEEKNPAVYSDDATLPSASSPISSQSGGHWNPLLPAVGEGLVTTVTETNPGPEKMTSSLTCFSQGLSSVSSGEKQGYKEAKSFLPKDSLTPFGSETEKRVTSEEASVAFLTIPEQHTDSELYSNLRNFQQTQRKALLLNDVRPVYHSVVVHGPQTHSFTKTASVVDSTAQTLLQHPSHLMSGKTLESFAQKDPEHSSAPSSEKPVLERPVKTVEGSSVFNHKPRQSSKIRYNFKGFTNLPWIRVKDQSSTSSDPTGSQPKGSDYGVRSDAKYASLSPKSNFGPREAFAPEFVVTTTDPSSPSNGILHVTQTAIASRFEEARSDYHRSSDGSNRKHRPIQISRRMSSLKGFSNPPLEGAKASAGIPDKSLTLKQGLVDSELGNSHIWQLNDSKNPRWFDQTGEKVQASQNMLQSDARSAETVKTSGFLPDKYKRSHKTYAFLGFQRDPNNMGHVKIHWKTIVQNTTTEPPTPKVFHSDPRSAGGPARDSSMKSESTTPSKNQPVAKQAKLLSRLPSSTAKGRRVKGKERKTFMHNDPVTVAIVRLSKSPVRVKTVPYTDILGSASFSSVRATTQVPVTPSDRDNFPNTTSHETENLEGRGAEEEKRGVQSEEGDKAMGMFQSFFGHKGSGSGGLNMSDVLSTGTTKTQALGENLLEMNYLQKSTANVSFQSMKLSLSDQ